jgi:glutamate-ammonia-ligase adenylyltransferase
MTSPDPERVRRLLAPIAPLAPGLDLGALAAASPDPDGVLTGLSRLAGSDPEGLQGALAGPAARDAVVALLAAGPFLTRLLVGRPGALADVVEAAAGAPLDWPEPAALADAAATLSDLQHALRDLKARAFLRLAARDLTRADGLYAATEGLTRLAEVTLEAATRFARRTLAERHGDCLRADGSPCPIAVIGMGKLGAAELNYGSDVDLVILYGDGGGETTGPRPATPPEFFAHVARLVIRALEESTDDGFVFRVDMRLRPEGGGAAVAWGHAAAMAYYETMGDTWERAAYVKARPVAGDPSFGADFLKELSPFVFRRYLDFAALEGIRSVQARIRGAIRASEQAGHTDVKRGRGGIRSIEFFVQAQQLIHGGRRPELRAPRTADALEALVEAGLVARADADFLADAYVFLRDVEHRVQLVAEEQTHLLPTAPEARRRLAVQMGQAPGTGAPGAAWEAFEGRYRDRTAKVHALWETLFQAPEAEGGRFETLVASLARLPEGADLSPLNLRDPEAGRRQLMALGAEIEAPWQTEQAARRWRRLVPLLLADAAEGDDPDAALRNLTRFVETLKGRSIYAAMLEENPDVRRLLARLFGASDYLSGLLARHPALLDDLLSPAELLADRAPDALAEDLAARLEGLDEEAWLDAIRRFKHREVLRVGLKETLTGMDAAAVGRALAQVAQAVLGAVLDHARAELEARHGRPPGAGGGPGHVAVVAMGRLGSGELAYGSDLDLVFIHNGDPDASTPGPRIVSVPEHYARLGRRIVSRLTLATGEGVLYEVDMRLRPSGASGQLVTSLAAFERYQAEQAWTWEKQALTRARVVAATGDFGRTVSAALRHAAYVPRDAAAREALRADVAAMRDKMVAHLGSAGADAVDFKQDPGGIVDVEFVVQYLLLAHGHDHPEVADPAPREALARLAAAGLLAGDDARALADALALFRAVELHLQRTGGASVRTLTRAGPPLPGGREAWFRKVEAARERVRAVYARVLGGTP